MVYRYDLEIYSMMLFQLVEEVTIACYRSGSHFETIQS